MRTSFGFTLGTFFSLIALSANAAGTGVAAPAKPAAQADVEVIVVTAKRPAVDALIEEIVVTAKRPSSSTVSAERAPPAMAVELSKLDIAITEPPVFRL